MLEANAERRFGDIAVMNYPRKFLGDTVLKEPPRNIPTIGLHLDDFTEQKSELEPFGFLNVSCRSHYPAGLQGFQRPLSSPAVKLSLKLRLFQPVVKRGFIYLGLFATFGICRTAN